MRLLKDKGKLHLDIEENIHMSSKNYEENEFDLN